MDHYVLWLLAFCLIAVFAHKLHRKFHGHRINDHRLDFKTEPHVQGEYTLTVVGEQYEGREAAVKKVDIGDELVLKREPNNKHDPNAVAVLTDSDEMIGYIRRANAGWVARLMDEGRRMKATVINLFEDERGFVSVQIHLDLEK